MTVQIRLFAMLRERAGRESIELELQDGATVSDVLRTLKERAPFSDLIGHMPVLLAVNREYATSATPLSADDELALIPPVSGGET
jgi:MoaE-MoaD fusion protein